VGVVVVAVVMVILHTGVARHFQRKGLESRHSKLQDQEAKGVEGVGVGRGCTHPKRGRGKFLIFFVFKMTDAGEK